MKKQMAGLVGISLVCSMLTGCFVETTELAQNTTYSKDGNPDGKATLMVYMCGTDLETQCGAATNDIVEMTEAALSEDVNILLYTGGTESWHNNLISGDKNQIWKIEEDGTLTCIEEDLGVKSMTDPNTLTEFIQYCDRKYPADRNGLILWDHGGGALYGFGSDEIISGDSMQLPELDSALETAGMHFDFIGFDACLMATVETAYTMAAHANYMIASEETEPASGWYYTNWLSTLCADPSISTAELGAQIVDDFINVGSNYGDCTLSVVDLQKMNGVYDALCDFSTAAEDYLDGAAFRTVSHSRNNTKSFGGDQYDTIDLMHFAQNLNIPESNALIASIEDAVVYSARSDNVSNSNGLTLYFPYHDIRVYQSMLAVYEGVGMGEEYTGFLTQFTNMLAGGQSYVSSNDPLSAMEGNTVVTEEPDFAEWESFDWFDESFVETYSDSYAENTYDSENLLVEDRGDYFALALSDEDWEIINDIQMQLFYDDGEGYVDLGTDNDFETDDDGALLVDYDGYWFAIDGQLVTLFINESSETYTEGSIPCILNDEYAELIVVWDAEHDGAIMGAQRYYENGMAMKGLLPLADGDTIQLICDYYTYDGDYEDYYAFGDAFVYESGMQVTYESSGAGEYLLYYVITDLYHNTYYTEPVILEFDEAYFTE